MQNPTQLARKKSDVTVLIITVIISLIVASITAMYYTDIFVFLGISLVVILIYIRMYQITLLGNALRVQNGKHGYLRDIANEITTTLAMPPVDIYITQNPTLNAFAIGYMRPFSIVLNSSIVEELSNDEIKAILLHEVGHIIYKHTIITSYLGPLSSIPLAGQLISWIFGFWSRRAELACDRFATAYMQNTEPMLKALINIHTGSAIGKYMDAEGVIYQDFMGRSSARSVAQSLGTHPLLVTRAREIIGFAFKNNIEVPQSVIAYINSGPAY